MDIRTIGKLALLLTAAVTISACQNLVLRPVPEPEPEIVAEPPEQEIEPEIVAPPDDLPASLRVRKALQMLEQGDYENARNQLNWALQEKPGLQIADNLLQQIDADPIEYLGVKSFYYEVESGDSLSIIAGKFLEDPMKFVSLARYNKLENPSKLAPGDRIRVPGKMPEDLWRKSKKKKKLRRSTSPPASEAPSSDGRGESAAMQAAPDDRSDLTQPQVSTSQSDSRPAVPPPPTLDQVIGTARKHHATGDLPGAISQLEKEGGPYAHEKALQKLQIAYYREYAEQLGRADDLEQSRMMLEKVVVLDAGDEQAIKDLIRVEDKLEARKLYRLGSDLLNGGQVENAYEMFTQSLIYDPENTPAKEAQLACREKLTDDYHRKAMSHFRHQELDRAIALWDKILTLDPGHPLASGYRARAMDMKQKLEKIESDQQ